MLSLVKVRIDINKIHELGKKLQNGDLDISKIKMTVCLKEDPSVGISVWETQSEKEFREKLQPMKEYYSEILEIIPVIATKESQEILMKQILNK